MDTIEWIKKEYETLSIGLLEDFVGCTIKWDVAKINLNIYQPHLITKMTQKFNKDIKSIITFNNPAISHKGIIHNQDKYTKILNNLQKRYSSGVGLLL